MRTRHLLAAALTAVALSGCAGWGQGMHGQHAQQPGQPGMQGMHGMQGMQGMHGAHGPMCGESMMSAQERDAHRRSMRAATSVAERERLHREHQDAMAARARERGVDLKGAPGCKM